MAQRPVHLGVVSFTCPSIHFNDQLGTIAIALYKQRIIHKLLHYLRIPSEPFLSFMLTLFEYIQKITRYLASGFQPYNIRVNTLEATHTHSSNFSRKWPIQNECKTFHTLWLYCYVTMCAETIFCRKIKLAIGIGNFFGWAEDKRQFICLCR